MEYKPLTATQKELKEIAALKSVQARWGTNSATEMKEILESIYVARFDFMNESPGYVGDLFILQPSFLDSDVAPTRLIRGRNGKLFILDDRQAALANELTPLT